MANKRMFSKEIIDSDNFLEMPQSTQCLYFHLSMRADDDGFINNPKRLVRMIGCADDDLKVLITKNFIIPFESGVIVITHWRLHNTIQKDRYKQTLNVSEKSQLCVDNVGKYSLDTVCIQDVNKMDTECIQDGNSLETQIRLDKISIDKISIGEDVVDKPQPKAKRFSPPTVAEVESYCQERKNSIDANKFVDYYTSNGWMVGRNKMKDWKSAVRTWEKRNFNDNSQKSDVFVDTYDYPKLKEGLI